MLLTKFLKSICLSILGDRRNMVQHGVLQKERPALYGDKKMCCTVMQQEQFDLYFSSPTAFEILDYISDQKKKEMHTVPLRVMTHDSV